MSTRNKPKREHFHMDKIKYLNQVVEFNATLDLVDGQETYRPKLNDKYPIVPSPDLTNLLDEFKTPLAKVHGLIDVETFVNDKKFDAKDHQKKLAKKHTAEKLKRITITGCSISGEDKKRGIVITGQFDGQAINSKRLVFTGTKYGFEADLEHVADAIEDELYAFVFDGKKAQLDAFDQADDELSNKDKAAGEKADED